MTAVSRRLDESLDMLSELGLGPGKAPSPDEGKDVQRITEDDKIPGGEGRVESGAKVDGLDRCTIFRKKRHASNLQSRPAVESKRI
jgi:hypothetical protein